MLKKTKLCATILLVAVCFAVALLTNIPAWLKYKKGDIKDLDTVAAGELQTGDLVRGTVNAVLGACAEEYSTKFGIRTSSSSSKLYYVLWLENGNMILYETGNKSEYDILDKISEETEDYYDSYQKVQESGNIEDLKLPTTTFQLEGRITKPSSKIEGFFKEWYGDDAEFAANTERVMITRANFDGMGTTVYIGFGAGVLAIIMAVVTLIVWKREREGSL